MQDALGVPLGLHDRLVRAASDVAGWAEPPVRGDVGHPQVGAIPGHARAVPGQPGKAATIRARTGGGVEIMAAGHHPRLGRPIHRKRHQLVDHVLTLMALPHTHQQLARGHKAQVGVAQVPQRRRLRRDRHQIMLPIDAVQALVALVTGEQRPARWKVSPATILMDPRAHIEPGGDGVGGARTFGPADHHGPAALGGTGLQPVDGLAAGVDRVVGGCLTGDLLTVDR
jgi:hypothetical protein